MTGMRTRRLKVTLRHVAPPVVRILDVPAGVVLPELHDLLQVAIGWTDSHLHQFVVDGVRYGTPDPDGWEDEHDETGVPLRALGRHCTYLYDFGDGWEHDVEVLGPGGDRPGLVAGEGACPPEDVGGPHGYAEFRRALADPSHPEHRAMRRWAGDWRDELDLAATDLVVRQMAGAVPAPVDLLLRLTADGVRLTPGGRLPRSLVRQVQQHHPTWHHLGDPARIEEDLPALATLHEVLRDVGLLRVRGGVLAPTRAAGDPTAVVRRLRSWFGPDDGFVAVLAGEAVASLVADGPCGSQELAARLFPRLGHGWMTSGGERLHVAAVRTQLLHLHTVLVGLDLVASDWDTWTAGPSARWLLPRATALAHLWAPGD
jgi:hypothetical protein